jgi:RNA polymerase sigma-70 factor (ECF subfamily)
VTRLAFAARDGDRTAFAQLVVATQADVWRLCALLVDRGAADDLTQETYVRAVTAITRYRGDATARTWLFSIARRVCIDTVRRRIRHRRILQRQVETGPVADRSGEIELHQLVASLGPDRRAAFTLTQVIGLTYDEAAAVLGCPVGTIRSRVARARGDLLGLLQDEPADEAAKASTAGIVAAGGRR